jgi:hypothetical protein
MVVDAGQRGPDGGGRGCHARHRSGAHAASAAAAMSKRPELRIIQGSRDAESGIYRLRTGSVLVVPAPVLEWPRAGAWRELIHRLLRKPVASE